MTAGAEPDPDCALCPRLVAYRAANREAMPDGFNAPVPSFGVATAALLVVGLAPGMKGANRSGRPFTGDHAGLLLYAALRRAGFARGTYAARADDGLTLVNCRITNAVRCVPPENTPKTAEITTCNRFLAAVLAEMPRLRVVLCLGTIAHDATLRALGLRRAAHPFRHGACHALPEGRVLVDSYHVSRYNTSTRRLTEPMFHAVMDQVAGLCR